MDRRFIKQFRRLFLAESFLAGAASLSKVFKETENELEDMIEYIGKKAKTQTILNEKLLKK